MDEEGTLYLREWPERNIKPQMNTDEHGQAPDTSVFICGFNSSSPTQI
jgi:hypothetical protein